MSNSNSYFYTDWAAMTVNDWVGLSLTVITFFLMIWAYVYAFNPKNKADFEERRYMPFSDDDSIRNGEENERK